jgi:hypothetical protein
MSYALRHLIIDATLDIIRNNEDRTSKYLYKKLPLPLWLKRIIINSLKFLFFSLFVTLPAFSIITLIYFFLEALIERFYPYVVQSPAWVQNTGTAAIIFIPILAFFYLLSKMELFGIEELELASGSVIEDNLERKIRGLMTSLEYMTKSINEIKEDIESRKKLADELQKDIEVGRLTKPQADAIKRSMREILNKESKKALGQNILLSIIFFILGVIATKYMT